MEGATVLPTHGFSNEIKLDFNTDRTVYLQCAEDYIEGPAHIYPENGGTGLEEWMNV